VTIEIGGNDACTPTIGQQTSTKDFTDQVGAALTRLVSDDPKVYIQVASIPDINQLWEAFTEPVAGSPILAIDPNAQLRWSLFNVCQALLANPTSTAQVDEDRRAAFQNQVIDYNGALAEVCAEFKRCLFDNNAVFNSTFTADDVANVTNTGGLDIFPFNVIPVFGAGAIPNSTADYFHPSLQGQASLAETSWNATFPMN
jgi:lysophospholipase L1-like esterase